MGDLSEEAQRAILRARSEPLSYEIRELRAPNGRLLVVIGEAHMKLAKAAALGKDLVSCFELRGVETFQRDRIFGGQALGWVIQGPRTLLRVLSLGAVKGSTITEAKQLPSGHTVELERSKSVPFGLHVASVYMTAFFLVAFAAMLAPLFGEAPARATAPIALAFQFHFVAIVPGLFVRRKPWSWLVHPFFGILTLRDELMATGTARMFEDHPSPRAACVVMGRAHVSGVAALLVEKFGFTPIPETA